MALWLFQRKSARKRSRSGDALSDCEGPRRSQLDTAVSRASSNKTKQKSERAKLRRRRRRYSFSPGRNDSIRVETIIRLDRPAGPDSQPPTQPPEDALVLAWDRTPTLHHKKPSPPARRKSSKRRRVDVDREAEIKAMSAHLPHAVPPATLSKQSSKRARMTADFSQSRNLPSNLSLPTPDSTHTRSSMSSDSDSLSFRVSVFDVLAPRPTLRCANPTATDGAHWRFSYPNRSNSLRKALAERDVRTEEMAHSRKRIDDLADDLGPGDLRELMERDHRRRERQRAVDRQLVERKLARRAESAAESATRPYENLERGVMGRELVGLGIDPPSAVVTSSKQRQSLASTADDAASSPPLQTFHRTSSIDLEEAAAPEEPIPIIRTQGPAKPEEAASAQSRTSFIAGLLPSKTTHSKSTLDSDKITSDDGIARKNSTASSSKTNRRSFTSLFRWGAKSKRNSGRSSFSNTSREEVQTAAQAQAEALAKLQGDDRQSHHLAAKAAAAPKRTRSRFREDLPDFPLSPPDSRVQSPEPELRLPMVAEVKTMEKESPGTLVGPHEEVGEDVPSKPRAIDGARRTSSPGKAVFGTPSPNRQQSMSLASIDSEGSWLSGRVGSRRASAFRDMMAAKPYELPLSSSRPNSSDGEMMMTADDGHYRRLSGMAVLHPSSECYVSSDEDDLMRVEPMQDGTVNWGAVGAKRQVIQFHRHDRGTMRSRQGFLNDESDDECGEAAM
ncbi:hypothetical protein RJ55_06477 [Drechmeria coniospora]|nr:hypothetical protein RJ55_06477 [Drechmeria coniospora]